MMRFKQTLMIGTMILGITSSFAITPASAATSPKIAAKAAIAVDSTTGQILYQKNTKQTLPIASISKLLTVYIVVQQIQAGKLNWTDQVKISPAVAKISQDSELTNVPLVSGRSYSVRELVNASLVVSANAAALALGQKVSGTSANFRELMQTTAKQLGIKGAKLYNAAGVTNGLAGDLKLTGVSNDAENKMSAQGVALLASQLLQEMPSITKITKKASLNFEGTSYEGHNLLLKGQSQAQPGLKVDGLKSGTSDAAGGSFVGTATKKGHRIVTVVLHAGNQSPTDPARYQQTAKLMNYVYKVFKPVTIAAGTKLKGASSAEVPNGKQNTVGLRTANAESVWIPKTGTKSSITGNLQLENNQKTLSAPVINNSVVGTAYFKVNGATPAYLPSNSSAISLTTVNSVDKANIFVRAWRAIVNWF
ncbi:D-alanyl-D-alanine carboxypeptidase [Lentilactobacillus senioris]|uniref:D-alanyl-D-alanine carboxypeptidase family protein n=1 Tax=Lentilactobacillus senioris TaxID=931534 RepID=UPI0022817377|nr:D-alanyl-D-alanine carboxypeptidase family protein [Lentilactobacillus senioris]MCY9807361.1 D-alanyl-D-alanine carboxypeptidase [Lentilactobacillus senioris]